MKCFSMDSPAYASKTPFDESRDRGGIVHDIGAIDSSATAYVGCVVQRKTAESCRQPGQLNATMTRDFHEIGRVPPLSSS